MLAGTEGYISDLIVERTGEVRVSAVGCSAPRKIVRARNTASAQQPYDGGVVSQEVLPEAWFPAAGGFCQSRQGARLNAVDKKELNMPQSDASDWPA